MSRKQTPKASIYGLRVKGDAEFFYIGSTERDPQVRLRAHLFGKNSNPFVKAHVGVAGRKNIEIEVIEQVSIKRRFKREYELINAYKARGANLCNIKLDDKPPKWLKNREWEIREVVARIEPFADQSFIGKSSWLRRGADREIVWLKMSVGEGDVSPDLLARIQALPWPKEFPAPITRQEVKSFCDELSINSNGRREYYQAANTWNRKAI